MSGRQAFSYAVPDGMTLGLGDAVFVPFGRRFLPGIVVATPEVPAFAEPKPVDARMGDGAGDVAGAHASSALWLADYYLAAPLRPPWR